MQYQFTQSTFSETEMDCFGNFDINHTLCKDHCTMRLNCIVERDYSLRLEVIEEMNTFHAHILRTQ